MAKGWGGQSPWEGEADFNPLISDHSAPWGAEPGAPCRIWATDACPSLNLSCGSVAQMCLILCRPHGLQHTRPPCLSLSPRVCPSSCTLSFNPLNLGYFDLKMKLCIVLTSQGHGRMKADNKITLRI